VLLEVVREVIADRTLVVELEPGRIFDRRDTWLDVRAAARVLGWHPTTPLLEGVRRTWELLGAGRVPQDQGQPPDRPARAVVETGADRR
jgi:nucleoside-diphosphate-sugar epimerase